MFTLLYVIFGWMFFFDFLVMFSSSKEDTPADTPAPLHPFLPLTSLAQNLRSLGTPIGQEVQAKSASVTTSLQQSVQGEGLIQEI